MTTCSDPEPQLGERAWASANSSPRSANSWRAMMVLRSRTRHCSAGDSCTAGIGSGWKAVRACALARNACAERALPSAAHARTACPESAQAGWQGQGGDSARCLCRCQERSCVAVGGQCPVDTMDCGSCWALAGRCKYGSHGLLLLVTGGVPVWTGHALPVCITPGMGRHLLLSMHRIARQSCSDAYADLCLEIAAAVWAEITATPPSRHRTMRQSSLWAHMQKPHQRRRRAAARRRKPRRAPRPRLRVDVLKLCKLQRAAPQRAGRRSQAGRAKAVALPRIAADAGGARHCHGIPCCGSPLVNVQDVNSKVLAVPGIAKASPAAGAGGARHCHDIPCRGSAWVDNRMI